MSRAFFYVIDHEEATENTSADLASDMISSYIDDIVGGAKTNSDFSMIETDLNILQKEARSRKKDDA